MRFPFPPVMILFVLAGCVDHTSSGAARGDAKFLSGDEILTKVIDQPLSTNVPSVWVFRSDGVEYSVGTKGHHWAAKGRWWLDGDVLCWQGVNNLLKTGRESGQILVTEITPYGPRCSRVVETPGGFEMTRTAKASSMQNWGLRKIDSMPAEPVVVVSQAEN
ncbi:hypothetical protein BV509_15395 [Rhodovulum sulfidophilum]|nr:hypothetical protein [Rhodovulum visakhapatnamense]OLS45590.1 hypothetical protein BV509_15395 [Rhodovulum sulfidophilum]